MKRYLTLFVLMCASAAFAAKSPFVQDKETGECCPNPIACDKKIELCAPNSIVQIGASYTYVWLDPDTSTFRGSLGGAQGLYEYRPNNSLYEGVRLTWRQGSTKHESESRFLLDIDVHERIGYTFANQSSCWIATVFTGVGYRYLGQELKQPAISTIEFNYNHFYIPVGFMTAGRVSAWCDLGLGVSWMPQVYSSVTIVPLSGANWIIKRTFGNVLIQAPITFSPCCMENFKVEFKPFFEYWRDGKTIARTETGLTLDTLRITYFFCGAELNFGWAF